MTELHSTDRDLGRVEGKLDMIVSLLTGQGERHDRLTSRVTKLEIAVGILTAGSGVATAKYFGLLSALFR